MRTLIFNFDGTLNGRDDEYPTNILRLHEAFDLEDQVSIYFEGPGNDEGFFGEILGGAFGVGSLDIRDEAIRFLRGIYREGDRIIVIGFSRGAAIARMFCALISEKGVNGAFPMVDFLGCFDTVGAFLPFGHNEILFHDLHVSPIVLNAYHAVSLDEDRSTFEPNLMNQRPGVTEVWFPGGHTDVGGGIEQRGLSDGALGWMLDMMSSHGIHADTLYPELVPDPTVPAYIAGGIFRRGKRKVGVQNDDVIYVDQEVALHESVTERITGTA